MSLFYTFHFYLFGVIAIAAAITFVTRESPVAAAMWLIVTMFCLAALYVMLDAQFVGAIQVLVYAGAIMVLFLFVVMLLNLGHASELRDMRGLWGRLIAGFLGIALLAELMTIGRARLPVSVGPFSSAGPQTNIISPIAGPLFHEYLLPFEITSVLLLAAIIGAVVVGRGHRA